MIGSLLVSALPLLFNPEPRHESVRVAVSVEALSPALADSIGTERRDGKYFVLHRVTQGQTLYAIARRYNTSADAIKEANSGMSDGVRYNQVLRVPQPEPVLSRKEERALRREEKAARNGDVATEQLMKPDEPAPATETKPARKPGKKEVKTEVGKSSVDIHVVEAGQTLYSLAVRYKVLMADLRKWNNLTNDNILLGQALIVSEKGYQARQTSSEVAVTTTTPRPDPKSEAPKRERETAKADPKPEPTFRPDPSKSDRSTTEERPIRPGDPGNRLPTKGRRMAEIGMAERIEADESSNKYLALHRSAPVGSLVQVRNDISNQILWVKVIGRLPATGVNERVLIKLSAKAFEKLSPNNASFRAEVSYMVP
ncbi:MAG: LysM peptidoglycan-binding domain-containing protein [Cytophagales bacterium]|nr:MAG: LysM peptidoglycan-binding domain-containing protein [Cytophagales bacterium]